VLRLLMNGRQPGSYPLTRFAWRFCATCCERKTSDFRPSKLPLLSIISDLPVTKFVRAEGIATSRAKVIRWITSPAYRLLGPVSSDSDRIRQATSVYIAFENTEVGC